MKKSRVKSNIKATPSDIFVWTLMGLLIAFYFGSLIYFAVIGRVRDSLLTLVYMLIVPLYFIIEKRLHVKIQPLDAVILFTFVLFCELGASYNLYTIIPCLDDVLHSVWGIVFTVLGFTIIKSFMGEPETKKAFIVYAVFGFAFCCLTAVLWEILEFSTDMILPSMDQQEDTIITSIKSFLLYPGYDHLHTMDIDGIAYTVLYDAEGNILYTIQGGYLDIGIMDTMYDIIFCTLLSFVLSAALIIERCAGKSGLYNAVIPRLVPVKEPEKAPSTEVSADGDDEPVAVRD